MADAVSTNSFSWMIGAPQGTGVDSSANLFARACVSAGLWIFGKREYHSNIIGEHSYFQIRVSDREIRSTIDPVHLLATFENTTAEIHAPEVIPGGALIYDPKFTHPENLKLGRDVTLVPFDFDAVLLQMAQQTREDISKLIIMKNVLAVAASFALLEFGEEYIEKGLTNMFTGRRAKMIPLNMLAARKAYEAVSPDVIRKYPYKLAPVPGAPRKLVMTGTIAVALAKLKAGCRFQTYYPITPASDESVYLEGLPEYGMLVMQCEDEIASVEQAISASIMGARASTSTSGPGFSLMAEGLGWAGMNEVPVVVVNYQRGGPATGLPTRHEQGDLFFAIHFAHGEFPRLVIAPGDHNEYFYDAFEAFNYADRYQTPVILLTDKNIGNNTQSILPFDESGLKIDRGKVATGGELEKLSVNGIFRRFEWSEDGISARSFPGQQGGIYWNSGDEHNAFGNIDESSANRVVMHDKRMRKLETADREIPDSEKVRLFGDPAAPLTIVSWGSTKGAILDALPVLESHGIRANFLQVHLLWPFPRQAVLTVLKKAEHVIGLEMNYSGQLCELIRRETGFEVRRRLLKFNGRPVSETEVIEGVSRMLNNNNDREVLTGGL